MESGQNCGMDMQLRRKSILVPSKVSKNLAFTTLKIYFINFNISFYNILNIKDFIFFTNLNPDLNPPTNP